MTTPGGPLGRARQALLDAREVAERNPSGANLKVLKEAQSHMDYLLDTLPLVNPSPPPLSSPTLEALLPSTPTAPGVSHPGAVVYPYFEVGGEHGLSLEDELLGEHDEGGEG